MKRKGQIGAFILFIFLAGILILVSGVTVKLGIDATEDFYEAGESLMVRANNTANQITLASIRDPIIEDLSPAIQATSTNRLIIQSSFQNVWLILLILMAVGIYLVANGKQQATRRGFI